MDVSTICHNNVKIVCLKKPNAAVARHSYEMDLHTGLGTGVEPKPGLQVQRKEPLFAIRSWR